MTKLEQAARQALGALEVATTPLAKDRQEVLRAITTLREALSGVQALSAAPAIGDELRDRLVAISKAIADQDDRTAQAMLREILAAPQPAPLTAAAGQRRSDLVPGVMHCAKCKFQLNRITLCVSDGNAYAGNNETEPCPNGCGPLWPVTWEQEARNCWKALEEMHERLHPAPTSPAEQQAPSAAAADTVALQAALRAIHQAIDLIGEPDTERLRTVRRVLRGAVIVAEDAGEAATAPQPSSAPQTDSQPAVQQWNDLIGKETHADADGLLVWRDEVDFAIPTPPAEQPIGEVVVTKTKDGQIVSVTRQDDEGRILSVIATSDPAEQQTPRCSYCDGTGDVHSGDGEWRGICTECEAGAALRKQSVTTEAATPKAGVTTGAALGGVYAELPQPDSWFHFTAQFWENKLYDFADRTHALRKQAAPKAAPGEQNTVPAEWLEQAYREGWAACRDAETIGEEAEDWAFGNSTANSRMIDAQQAAPKQEAQEPVAWLNPWRADQVTTDYDAYGERGIPLYTAPRPAPAPLSDDVVKDALSAAPSIGDELRDTLVAVSAAVAEGDDRAAQKMICEILAASTTPPAEQQAQPGAVYAELPRAGAIGYASVVDVDRYAIHMAIGPHLPGVRDIALWTTDQLRDFADRTHALRIEQAAPEAAPGEQNDDVVKDAAFEAVRKKLCTLPRYSFVLDDNGFVPDRTGNWIEFDEAHALFDPVSVEAALAAQGGK